MTVARRKQSKPKSWPLYTWRSDRKAGLRRIRESIRHAIEEKREMTERFNDAEWMANACTVSQQWAQQATARPIRQLAREHLEYWRLRAFMSGAYTDFPGDKPARDRWSAFA